MRSRIVATGLWCGLALLVAGCATKEGETDAKAAAEQKAEQPAAPTKAADTKDAAAPGSGGTKTVPMAPSDPPTIELVSAGAEPREVMRLAVKPGDSDQVDMTMKLTMAMDMNGQKVPPMVSPPIVMHGKVTVDTVEGEEISNHYDVSKIEVVDAPGANPAMVQTMRGAMGQLESFSAKMTMNRRGVLISGEATIPADLSPPLQQNMDQMIESMGRIQVPLPREPVGTGAKWNAVSTIEQGGMKLKQVATYEVARHEGPVYDLVVSLSQELASKDFKPPGLPPGAKVDIDSFGSTGKGKLQLDLRRLSPPRSEMDLAMKMAMRVEAMGQKQAMAMDMDMNMLIESKPQ